MLSYETESRSRLVNSQNSKLKTIVGHQAEYCRIELGKINNVHRSLYSVVICVHEK